MENNNCIYVHLNKTNDKVYIGQTNSIERRWCGNGVHYKNCPAFYNAIQKYGWDNFEHIILEDGLTKEEANEKEIQYIQEFNSCDPNFGYNIALGGQNTPRPFVSEYLKEKWKDPEYRQKKIESMSGEKSHFYGQDHSGENNPMYGKHHSEETKRKISEKAKARYAADPTKSKGRNNGAAKPIVCLTTGQHFGCQREAANWARVGYSTMSRWLRGETQTTGYHPETGEPLEWAYEKDIDF